jgi:subtilisin
MIVMPLRGLRTRGAELAGPANSTLFSLYTQFRAGTGPAPLGASLATAAVRGPVDPRTQIRVLDSIAENGAKLIEIHPGEESAVRMALTGDRMVPEVFYQPMSLALSLESELQPAGAGGLLEVTVRSAATGQGIAGVKVVGFTDFAERQGAESTTDANGVATLAFGTVPARLERLYAFPRTGFWGAVRMAVRTAGPLALDLAPIDLAQAHPLAHYFGEPALTVGTGVTVGVIDTGCGPHPDLLITGGMNCVSGQNATDFSDNGDQHGTHVAGIIAGRGTAPAGLRGVAPGVRLFSYRVFAQGRNASNFDIARAIDRAREDGCDLINLSLGRPAAAGAAPGEPVVRIALEDAREGGLLPIAAAGNDHRAGVAFPGADDLCVAVSALGDTAVLPRGSSSAATAMQPPGALATEFIADFSNVGPELDLTGPGVGVVSTVPGPAFAVMDGTSMACPAVTGIAARRLETRPDILTMTRDGARAAAIEALLLGAALTRGFTPPLEGRGLPQ